MKLFFHAAGYSLSMYMRAVIKAFKEVGKAFKEVAK